MERIPLRRRHGLASLTAGGAVAAAMDVDGNTWAGIYVAVAHDGQFFVFGGRPECRVSATWTADAVLAWAVTMDAGDQRGDAWAVDAGIRVGVPGGKVGRRNDEQCVVVDAAVILAGLAHCVAVVASHTNEHDGAGDLGCFDRFGNAVQGGFWRGGGKHFHGAMGWSGWEMTGRDSLVAICFMVSRKLLRGWNQSLCP